MEKIKTYTSIQQSKILSEILPADSADMYYGYNKDIPDVLPHKDSDVAELCLPCWSLGALFSVLPKVYAASPILAKSLVEDKFYCHYMGIGSYKEVYTSKKYDNAVDACVETIEFLNDEHFL